jgi:hypothetical protein
MKILGALAELGLAFFYLLHPAEYERALRWQELRAALGDPSVPPCSRSLPEPAITP